MFRHVLILILTTLFLAGVPPAPEAPGRGRAGWTVESVQELMEAMDVVHRRLEERWTKWFATKYEGRLVDPEKPMYPMGYDYMFPDEAGNPVTRQTSCEGGREGNQSISSNEPNALYCQKDHWVDDNGDLRDGVVHIPIEPLFEVLSGNIWSTEYPMRSSEPAVAGELLLFAATLIAHESGHGVQNAYFVQTGDSFLPGPQSEQFADCIAGDLIAQIEDVFLPAARDPELIEAIRIAGFAAIGDLIPIGEGADPFDRAARFHTHGWAEQRLYAFEQGYRSGKTSRELATSFCFNQYPPQKFE